MFINRKDGKIVEAFANKQYEGQEFVAADAQELLDFYAENTPSIGG